MLEFIEKFGIEFHLIVAQIINFGILVFVLYKFIYKPVLKILDDRKSSIESSVMKAKEIEEKSKTIESEISNKIQESKNESARIIDEAKKMANSLRNEIIFKTNQEAENILISAKKHIETEKQEMMKGISEYIINASLLLVEKVLNNIDNKEKALMIQNSLEKELKSMNNES